MSASEALEDVLEAGFLEVPFLSNGDVFCFQKPPKRWFDRTPAEVLVRVSFE